jgi:hypothetical protein
MISRAWAAAAAVLILAFSVAAQHGDGWFNFKSDAGGYSVSMPQKPNESQQQTKAKTGEMLQQYMAMAMDGEAVFLTGYMDMEPTMKFSFDDAVSAMATGMNATPSGQRSISLGSSPGREYQLDGKLDNGLVFIDYVRIYQVDKRIYVLQHLIPAANKGTATSAKTTKFFDSFGVNKK